MLNTLLSYLRKLMPKPRTIELPEGTVKLYNFSKEAADKFEEFVTPKPMSLVSDYVIPEQLKSEPVLVNCEVLGNLPNTALGLVKNSSGNWEVVVVKFNSTSKEAQVEKTLPAGDSRINATSEFKIQAVKLNII